MNAGTNISMDSSNMSKLGNFNEQQTATTSSNYTQQQYDYNYYYYYYPRLDLNQASTSTSTSSGTYTPGGELTESYFIGNPPYLLPNSSGHDLDKYSTSGSNKQQPYSCIPYLSPSSKPLLKDETSSSSKERKTSDSSSTSTCGITTPLSISGKRNRSSSKEKGVTNGPLDKRAIRKLKEDICMKPASFLKNNRFSKMKLNKGEVKRNRGLSAFLSANIPIVNQLWEREIIPRKYSWDDAHSLQESYLPNLESETITLSSLQSESSSSTDHSPHQAHFEESDNDSEDLSGGIREFGNYEINHLAGLGDMLQLIRQRKTSSSCILEENKETNEQKSSHETKEVKTKVSEHYDEPNKKIKLSDGNQPSSSDASSSGKENIKNILIKLPNIAQKNEDIKQPRESLSNRKSDEVIDMTSPINEDHSVAETSSIDTNHSSPKDTMNPSVLIKEELTDEMIKAEPMDVDVCVDSISGDDEKWCSLLLENTLELLSIFKTHFDVNKPYTEFLDLCKHFTIDNVDYIPYPSCVIWEENLKWFAVVMIYRIAGDSSHEPCIRGDISVNEYVQWLRTVFSE